MPGPSGSDVLVEARFSADSLLTRFAIRDFGYEESYEYLGTAERTFIGVPTEVQEAIGRTRHLDRFEGRFAGIAKVWGVGFPNHQFRSHNFAMESRGLTREEYEQLRWFKAAMLVPVLPADASDISLTYVDTDYRDGNYEVFLRYHTSAPSVIADTSMTTPTPKNTENSVDYQIGSELAPPSTWTGTRGSSIDPRWGTVHPDSLWLYAESPHWRELPQWWKPGATTPGNDTRNTSIWENHGSPWSEGKYIHQDPSSQLVHVWQWRRQWFSWEAPATQEDAESPRLATLIVCPVPDPTPEELRGASAAGRSRDVSKYAVQVDDLPIQSVSTDSTRTFSGLDHGSRHLLSIYHAKERVESFWIDFAETSDDTLCLNIKLSYQTWNIGFTQGGACRCQRL